MLLTTDYTMVVKSTAADDYNINYSAMSPLEDAERWNKRYETETRQTFEQARHFLIANQSFLPTSGLALDLAMGLGGNAEFLLSHGLHVVGVDIADVAVRKAKKKLPALMALVADLTQLDFPQASFDVILNFFYLERSLWDKIPTWLKPGGIFMAEILTIEMQSLNPQVPASFLLSPGELGIAFSGLETVVYEEGWYGDYHPRATARLISRKPFKIT